MGALGSLLSPVLLVNIIIALIVCRFTFQYIRGWLIRRRLLATGLSVKNSTREITEREVASAAKGPQPSADISRRLKNLSVQEIHGLLIEGKVTCVQLLNFFISCLTPDVLDLNLVAVTTYAYALPLAQKKDEELKLIIKQAHQTGNPVKLTALFGIPISLKDVLELEGYDTSLGSARFLLSPSERNCTVVESALNAGAIPFVKTTVPQILLINETNNFIWGRAKNPWNTDRSPGGSSGGEAGLLCLGASPIGIGTDGGGSVRIPASYCGLYSVRPTTKRFAPFAYKIISSVASRHLFNSAGPMGKCLDDCTRVVSALLAESIMKKHPTTLPLPWKDEILHQWNNKPPQQIRIGLVMGYPVDSA